MTLTLVTLQDNYAVWQPDAAAPISLSRFKGSEFYTISETADELSIVCPVDRLPAEPSGKVEKTWKGFKVEGQLDFALVGIMAQISNVLADNKISLFAVSTFDTDYILVKDDVFADARNALSKKFTVKEEKYHA